MDSSAALTADAQDLYLSVGLDPAGADPLAGLNHDLKIAVPSYLGLRLVLAHHHHPISLVSFPADVRRSDIRASLQLPVCLLAAGVTSTHPECTITFYAGAPGAFIDLAADLAYPLRRPEPTPPSRPFPVTIRELPAPIAMDMDLRPNSVVSGITGTEELVAINRAIGLLIGDGHDPDRAPHELNRRAAVAGVTRAALARQLIGPVHAA